jgi:hypothetical protein
VAATTIAGSSPRCGWFWDTAELTIEFARFSVYLSLLPAENPNRSLELVTREGLLDRTKKVIRDCRRRSDSDTGAVLCSQA